eukprot:6804816-Alexandrium_andersonii.AAC.1
MHVVRSISRKGSQDHQDISFPETRKSMVARCGQPAFSVCGLATIGAHTHMPRAPWRPRNSQRAHGHAPVRNPMASARAGARICIRF